MATRKLTDVPQKVPQKVPQWPKKWNSRQIREDDRPKFGPTGGICSGSRCSLFSVEVVYSLE